MLNEIKPLYLGAAYYPDVCPLKISAAIYLK
jgi:hypothetical protein